MDAEVFGCSTCVEPFVRDGCSGREAGCQSLGDKVCQMDEQLVEYGVPAPHGGLGGGRLGCRIVGQ
ncbi:MAG: hypothetical protein M3Z06_13400 [Actinomycetota bacterium]|nr:hypothetical protein [Actinomycetota bacterium]